MEAKQSSSSKKKNGEITRSEKTNANAQAISVLKNVKEKTGDVIHIAISSRTTIELPAYLSAEEINARIERYMRLHKSNI